jgi:choline-sulfatase
MSIKNIVLITVDCLRYDRCGFNGYGLNTTPFLDSLANEGNVYERAYSTGPWTSESFPGILAGLQSHNSSFVENPGFKAIPEDQTTIAEQLRKKGYQTRAVLSNPQLSRERNFDMGFEVYNNLRLESDTSVVKDSKDNNSWMSGFGMWDMRKKAQDSSGLKSTIYEHSFKMYRWQQYLRDWPSVSADQVIEEFINNLEELSEPFFAWTHLMDLHAPLNPDAADKGEFSGGSTTELFKSDFKRIRNEYANIYDAQYDSTLQYIDGQIERIWDHLQENNLARDTAVIVTADHGEALFDRGIYGHAAMGDEFPHGSNNHYLYDELLHVPLLVWTPDNSSKRIEPQFSLKNLHSLVSELTGKTMSGFESSNEPPEREVIVSDCISTSGHTIAVRDGPHKAIISNVSGEDHVEGFNLLKDPKERRPTDLFNENLIDIGRETLISPEELEPLGGQLSNEVDDLLEQLGYKAGES